MGIRPSPGEKSSGAKAKPAPERTGGDRRGSSLLERGWAAPARATSAGLAAESCAHPRALAEGVARADRQGHSFSGVFVGEPALAEPAASAGASTGAETARGAAAQQVNRTGIPDELKAGLESLGKVSLDDVQVHYDSPRPSAVRAHATTRGERIDIAPGQDHTLAHEGWHVVQQKQGRVQVTGHLGDGTPLNEEAGLEAEADRMGAAAARWRGPAPATDAPRRRIAPATAPLQRNYAGLTPMGQARVDQQAEEKYAEKTLEYELGMAPIILADGTVGAAVDSFVVKIKRIVDAWAQHTGQQQAEAYEAEFGWDQGHLYYGAFEATANTINAILSNPAAKPVRVKLKLIYNAVRNNNFSKWLKLAANEIDRANQGRAARNWRIRTQSRRVVSGPAGLGVRSQTRSQTVTTGFAGDSGLAAFLQPGEVTEIAGIFARERQKPGWRTGGGLFSSRRDVFGHDKPSGVVGWKPETLKAHRERRAGANRDVTLAEQRTLTVGDVNGLTDEEVDLILRRQGNNNPQPLDRQNYRAVNANTVPWTQGGEYYDVELGSDSAREAQQILARMEAGISGSTDLMLHAMNYLEFSPVSLAMRGLRMALAGWMIANRDHSFYEVFKASAAYGMVFNTDPAHPGSEYTDAANLSPMAPVDFAGILPNEGPLVAPVPADYLSVAWKDHLSNALVNPALTQDQVKTALVGAGINRPDQAVMTPRETAALASLEAEVAGHAINVGDRAALKLWEVRRIKEHPSYILLANTFGEPFMEHQLNQLLLQHHANKGVTVDDAMSRLMGAGVPVITLEGVSATECGRMDAVRARVEGAVPVAAAIPVPTMTQIDLDIGQLQELSVASRSLLKNGLIRHYHPTVNLDGGTDAADTQDRIRQVEAIAATNRTTGTWYTWNSPQYHQAMIGAPSLRAATADVTSTQGPGMYVGRNITTSSGYGAALGRRVLVVKMSGVPTIDATNPAQVARLALLQPRQATADPLDAAYLYSRQVPGEFLMIYGAGDFARLTTNKNVQLTMDVRQAPEAHLRAQYAQAAHWAGQSRTNFVNQAQHYGLNTAGW